ncbi:unannotated protein [freshwater metagenome]
MRLGDKYPACAEDLTPQIAFGLELGKSMYNIETRGRIESQRVRMNECMADVFDQVDFVFASTNPDVAFGSHGPLPETIDGKHVGLGNNGALTIPANIYGNPAVSIPTGLVRGLPVGLQVLAPHHREQWLLDMALAFERARPWPLTAPGGPA